MTATNGHITIITTQGGGLKNGIPQAVAEVESAPIPANINSTTHRHYDTGSEAWVTQQGYSILIDMTDAEVTDLNKVALYNSRGQHIGTFEIQEAKLLDFVEAIQITI